MSILYRLRIFVLFLICLAIFAPLFTVEVQASPTTWIIETVDASNNVGTHSSIAIDSDGFPHISYYDLYWENLKYARWTGIDWIIMPVDSPGDVGWYTSLALDSSDNPHISYYDITNEDLKYARWTGTTWSIETVDSTGDVGFDSSLALDSGNNPHISYYDSTYGDLKYARWTGTAWSIETVDSTGSVGIDSSLALDSGNNPHISYYDITNTDLKYARWTGTAWSIETVDSAFGGDPSIALDSGDKPHISYLDWANSNLKYARWTGVTWSIETFDTSTYVPGASAYPSLALDSSDNPHISYRDITNEDLKYARWTGTTWSIETVDPTGYVGFYSSLALDSNDLPHISYYGNTDLKYAATSDEYFASVNVTPFDSDGDGYDDAVEIQMNVDTSYSGTIHVQVFARLVDSFGYYADSNTTSWDITEQSVEWIYIYLHVPPGYFDGPSMYDLELALFDDDNFFEDFHHEIGIYLYPPRAMIESCNLIGERKDTFELEETVCVSGGCFSPSTGYSFYIVVDQETWTNGMSIPERVPGTETSISSNADGAISPTIVWHNPQTAGNYDIVVDINKNGQYDAYIDALDDGDIEVTAGLSIIPELSSILLLFVIATLTVIIYRKRIT